MRKKSKVNGNVFWLGDSTKKFELPLRNENQELIEGNLTNLNSPLFQAENEC